MLIKMVIGEAQQFRSIETTNTYFLHRCSIILMPLSLVASDRPTYVVHISVPSVYVCATLLFEHYECSVPDSCHVMLQH